METTETKDGTTTGGAPTTTGPEVNVTMLPPKRPIRPRMVLTGLLVLAVILLAVPIIQGLHTETIGALNPAMKLWFLINSTVISFLGLLLYLTFLKKVKLTRLWQFLVGLMIFNGLLLATQLADVKIAGQNHPLIKLSICFSSAILVMSLIAMVFAGQHRLVARYNSGKLSEITLFSYPKLVYIWVIIALGFLFNWPIGYYQWVSENALGWWYLVAMMTVLLTTCIDLNRVTSLLWLALIAIITLTYFLVSVTLGETFMDEIGRWFASLTPPYPTKWALALSVVASIPYVIMFIGVRINDRWFISHNQFEHRTVLGKDDSLARGAKRVKATYPDILELLLLGSGTLTIYSAQGKGDIVLAEIRNIPFLFFRMGHIDRILESTQVDVAAEEESGGEEGAHG